MGILESDNLCKTYGSGESEVKALDHVTINIEDGEFISIVGTSGSGKSTLLNMLGGLDRPDSGTVNISGKQIFSMSDEELTIFRRRNIGFIFQNYNLVPVLNVYENIVLPIELDGSDADKSYVGTVINTLGIGQKLTAMPNMLSGGQQQRVAIARSLIYRPALLLADEPTGNLDQKNSGEIMDMLKLSNRNLKQTILLITHDEKIALQADRIITVEDGRIVSDERRG